MTKKPNSSISKNWVDLTHHQNPSPDKMMTDFFKMLRAVVDGDEKAREDLRTFLDMFDKYGYTLPSEMMSMPDENEDNENVDSEDIPLTLPRTHVREMHLRIKINNTDLKIWREIKVPSNLTLTALGEVLQDAMGWMHEHLYQFRKGDVYFVDREQMEDSFGFDRFSYHDMAKCTVDDMLTEKGKRVVFEYDFGDSWEHDVWCKGEREYNSGEKPSITFVKGQGACPPEDCGGIWGYEDFLEIRKKKKLTQEERESLEWYAMDGDFDPDTCDDEEIAEMMQEWTCRLQQSISN